MGGTLPLPTRMIINLSNFIAGIGGLLVAGVFVAFIFFIRHVRRTEKGKLIIDRILLKLPVFGVLLNKVAVAKFTRTLGTLVSSGVPILDGLEITAKTSGNKVIEFAIMEVFPPMVTHMIAVGESTGALDSMLSKIADFFDDEVDASVNNLTAMMEPMLMVFLGGAVGYIVVALYLPIFKLLTLVK
jgi:type IV pilus assembly protein PilC